METRELFESLCPRENPRVSQSQLVWGETQTKKRTVTEKAICNVIFRKAEESKEADFFYCPKNSIKVKSVPKHGQNSTQYKNKE